MNKAFGRRFNIVSFRWLSRKKCGKGARFHSVSRRFSFQGKAAHCREKEFRRIRWTGNAPLRDFIPLIPYFRLHLLPLTGGLKGIRNLNVTGGERRSPFSAWEATLSETEADGEK